MLTIYNANDQEQADLFIKLYREYIAAISIYSERLQRQPVTQKEVDTLNQHPWLIKYFITNAGHNVIGFCLLGYGTNTQCGTDWYIAEYYIIPEYQRQGYGQQAVAELLQKHPGIFCYFVLDNNTPAQRFWDRVLQQNHCNDLTHLYICEQTPSDCTFHAFSQTQTTSAPGT